jgi:hypothetical protein
MFLRIITILAHDDQEQNLFCKKNKTANSTLLLLREKKHVSHSPDSPPGPKTQTNKTKRIDLKNPPKNPK